MIIKKVVTEFIKFISINALIFAAILFFFITYRGSFCIFSIKKTEI